MQRDILILAAENYEISAAWVLEKYFGWKITPSTLDGWLFRRKKIGERTYANAMSTLSRACRRLLSRGLIECEGKRRKNIRLTAAGVKWITVNYPLQRVKTVDQYREEIDRQWAALESKVSAALRGEPTARERKPISLEAVWKAYLCLSSAEQVEFIDRVEDHLAGEEDEDDD